MILFAFASEFESGASCMVLCRDGLSRSQFRVVLVGIGSTEAAQRLEELILTECPKMVVSAGFAAGLNPDLCAGDVLIAANMTTPALLPRFERLPGCRTGILAAVSELLVSPEAKARSRAATNADIADMETGAILERCLEHRVPLLAIRAISDDARTELPLPPKLMVSLAERRPGTERQLLRFLLDHPGRLQPFFRLTCQAFRARRALARALSRVSALSSTLQADLPFAVCGSPSSLRSANRA